MWGVGLVGVSLPQTMNIRMVRIGVEGRDIAHLPSVNYALLWVAGDLLEGVNKRAILVLLVRTYC
jgi:hypothetical protein